MDKPSQQLRVLIVDDEFIIASTLALILRHKGFDAYSFTSPIDALESARAQAPDLLISDVVMPHFSGIELALRIREECPLCRVLLFSGQAATESLLLASSKQGHHFEIMAKPVHPTELLRRIGEATAGTSEVVGVGTDAPARPVPPVHR